MRPIPAGFVEIGVFVASVACTAFSEELVMRAYLIPRFEQLLGSSARSVALSALLFASYHVYQGIGATVSMLFYGLNSAFCFAAIGGFGPSQ
jgi:membrane protease YdiL (CAAX protease family)